MVPPVSGVMVRCGDAGSDIILLCHQRNVPVTQSRLVTRDRVRPGQVIWTVHLGIQYNDDGALLSLDGLA